MKLLIGLLFASSIFAQTVVDVAGIATLAQQTATIAQTITGTDGTVRNIVKQPSTTIYATFNCTNTDGKSTLKTVQIQTTDTFSYSVILGQSTVLRLIGVNPTAAIVSFGSVGSAPVKGIVWSCSTGDGITIKTGSVVWP